MSLSHGKGELGVLYGEGISYPAPTGVVGLFEQYTYYSACITMFKDIQNYEYVI